MEVMFTAGVARQMEQNPKFGAFVIGSLLKFESHDWGDTGEEDKALNDSYPNEALASYKYNQDGIEKIWIKNDDYGEGTVYTTVLFPSEY